MFYKIVKYFLFVPVISLISLTTGAQTASDSDWKFLIEPYLMFPSMKGATGIGDLPDVSVDANAKDIFSNLKIGAMLNAEAYTELWAIGMDILYMKLTQDVTKGTLITDGSLELEQFAWEASGLRQLLPWMEVGLGGRFNRLAASGDLTTRSITGTENRSRSTTKSWFDPIIIIRVTSAPEKLIFYQFRSDLGGFGIGADLTWQIQGYIGYHFSELFQLSAGYRIISVDYESGTGNDRFKYDIDTSGPVIRLGFNL